MHLKIKLSDLSEVVRIAQKGVSKNTKSNIYEGILFHAEGETLTLYSTDLRISVKTSVEAEVIEPGKWVIPSFMIADATRYMSGDFIEIKVDETGKVTLKCGSSKLNMVAMSADEYPTFPEWSADESITISSQLFRELLRYTRVSVSNDENMNVYTGVKFSIRDGKIEAVSLDNYRITIIEKEISGNTDVEDFIVPFSALSDVEKLLKEDEDIIIRKSKSHAVFCFGKTILYTKLLEGDFYDVNQIITNDPKASIICDLKQLILAFERSNIIERVGPSIVRVELKDGNLKMQARGNMGESKDDIKVEQEGEDLILGFNAKYLIEGLKMFDEDKVSILFGMKKSSVKITGLKHKNITYLVFPVKISV